ncbi:hypothetical protein DFH28DRAFT_420012 [Melampsora americana]|nr:hypothetical protein DFH28DRAFT_420012 [Melampsora americana]
MKEMKEFIKWCKTNELQLHPSLQIIQLQPSTSSTIDQQYSIRLIKSNYIKESFISKDTIVASIPKSICLSHRTSSLNLQKIKSECQCEVSKTSSLILTQHLLHEIKLNQESKWSPYLSIILPSSNRSRPRLISLLEPNLIQDYFKGTEIERCFKSDQTIKYESLLHFYQSHLFIETDDDQHEDQAEWETFLDAYLIVSSRSFYIDNFHTLALVPIADLFDHSDQPDVNLVSDIWVCDQCGSLNECELHESDPSQMVMNHHNFQNSTNDQDRVELKALVPIEDSNDSSDRIVYNSYGPKLGNHKLFIEYGFIIPENIHDRITFDLEGILKVLDLKLNSYQISILDKRIKSIRTRLMELITEIDENELIRFKEEEEEEEDYHEDHDKLYIDSSARVSLTLWIAVLLLDLTVRLSSNLNDHELLDFIENLINFQLQDNSKLHNFDTFKSPSIELSRNIQKLCDSRLIRMFGNQLSLDQLLDLKQDVLTPLLDKSYQDLIIDYLVAEKLLLQSCKTRWIELDHEDGPSSLS